MPLSLRSRCLGPSRIYFYLGMGKNRQRDIFPLPLSLFDSSDDPSGSVCRSVRRRALRRNHALEVARKSAVALNQLYGGEGGSLPASGHSDAQCAVAHN